MGKSWGSSSWLRALKRAFRAPTQKRICGPREVVVENDEVEKKRGKGRSAFRKPPNQENAALHQSCHERTISTTSKVSTRRAATTAAVRRSEEEDVVRVAMATAVAAQAAVATAKAALQALPLIRPPIDHRREYCAAVVIQTAFRGYLSRRALRALKGLVKLQALVRGNNVRKQVEMTLQCMQSLVRVQDQVCKQRRRLPLEGSFCWSSNGSFDRKIPSRDRISAPHDRIDDCQLHNLEKIKSMFEQLKEINLQSEEDPAFTFSQQEWRDLARHQLDSEEEPAVKELRRHNQWVARSSKSRTSCDRGDAVKMIKIDTRTNYSTPISQESPFKWKDAIHEKHSASPHLVSDHWNRHELPQTPTYNATSNLRSSSPSSGAQPNYMAATASAMAKSRSQSTPKQRFLTLERERPQSARKRLSFPAPDESGNLDRDFDRCLSRPIHQESHGFGHNWRNDLSS